MKYLLFALNLCVGVKAYAFGIHPNPVGTPSVVPVIKPKFVQVINYGVSVNHSFTDQAVGYLNAIYANGCIHRSVLGHVFKSLNSIIRPIAQGSRQAYERYTAGLPHKIDIRWYTMAESNTLGYTYNFRGNTGETETRIFSNTKYHSSPKAYAGHLAHEISHQAQAGGFVHYTIHKGSFPYDIGSIAGVCLKELVQ